MRDLQQRGGMLDQQQYVSLLGLRYTADGWTAVSSVATAAAVIVALIAAVAGIIVPSRLALRAEREARRVDNERRNEAEREKTIQRQEADAAIAAQLHEAVAATYNAIDLVVEALGEVKTTSGRDELPILAARCRSSAETLGILARRPSLTDGAVDGCVGAQQALLAVVRANDYFRSDDLALDPWLELEGALLIAQHVMDRAGRVVAHHQIPVRAGRPLPVLPTKVSRSAS